MSTKVKKHNRIVKQFIFKDSPKTQFPTDEAISSHKLFPIDFKSTSGFKRCHVKVEFVEGLPVRETTDTISELSAPQVLLWYIGCYGLRKTGVQFYRDFLISPVLKQNKEATFWLVDLTGWNAFKSSRGSIYKSNSCCDKIESISDPRVKCIRSAEIFKKMQFLENDLAFHFRKSVQKEFIKGASKDFPNVNIRVSEIFSGDCSAMADWYDYDVSKSYSAFQYLEGCLLIDEIFIHMISTNLRNNFQIVFALPNDELKYYKDEAESFKNDVDFLISKRCEDLNIKNITLQVKFVAFKYGSQVQHRPYNAPGIILKNNDLTFEEIIGHDEQIKDSQIEAATRI